MKLQRINELKDKKINIMYYSQIHSLFFNIIRTGICDLFYQNFRRAHQPMTKAYFILEGEHIKIVNWLVSYVFFDKAYNKL